LKNSRLISGESRFNTPGQVLIHRVMSVSLKIQHIFGMVYKLLNEIRVQDMTCEHFDCGVGLCIEKGMSDRNGIIQELERYF
jgi:hypothetical protein